MNMDTNVHPELINARFAYVSVSRASQDAQIFTNDATNLSANLSRDVSKSSALSSEKVQISPVDIEMDYGPSAARATPRGLGLAL